MPDFIRKRIFSGLRDSDKGGWLKVVQVARGLARWLGGSIGTRIHVRKVFKVEFFTILELRHFGLLRSQMGQAWARHTVTCSFLAPSSLPLGSKSPKCRNSKMVKN